MAVETKKIKIETPEELYKFLGEQTNRLSLAEEWIIYLEAEVKRLGEQIGKTVKPFGDGAGRKPQKITDFYMGRH